MAKRRKDKQKPEYTPEYRKAFIELVLPQLDESEHLLAKLEQDIVEAEAEVVLKTGQRDAAKAALKVLCDAED